MLPKFMSRLEQWNKQFSGGGGGGDGIMPRVKRCAKPV